MKTFLIILSFFFPGTDYLSVKNKAGDPVKIGLLIPAGSSVAARQGAELAIQEANRRGGYKGRPFKIVVRSMEGPWGMGSKQAVDLIFNEEVWAILGSHDGRNAHLVEQATVKTRVVFLSAWAGDPTLSQAFVPTYFSCVPNDMQQADALISEIWNKRKVKDVIIVHDQEYDSRQAFDAFKRQSAHAGIKLPEVLEIKSEGASIDALEASMTRHQAAILFCSSKNALLISAKKKKEPAPYLFGSLRIMDENILSKTDLDLLKQKLWVPFNSGLNQAFMTKFFNVYKRYPGYMSAYAYDGMNALVAAILNAGLDHEAIRASMEKIHVNGITGSFGFDTQGNRKSQ